MCTLHNETNIEQMKSSNIYKGNRILEQAEQKEYEAFFEKKEEALNNDELQRRSMGIVPFLKDRKNGALFSQDTDLMKDIIKEKEQNARKPKILKKFDENDGVADYDRVKRASEHRYSKTRKSKFKTANAKMKSINEKYAELDKAENKMSPDQRMKEYGELFASIRSADRYYAESFANTKLGEQKIKLRADIRYCENMINLYFERMKSLEELANSQQAEIHFSEYDEKKEKKENALEKTQGKIKALKTKIKEMEKAKDDLQGKLNMAGKKRIEF